MDTVSIAPLPDKEVESSRSGADERPHAIVIGSGFGGLASAIRLGAKGYRVTVLEALDAPGGRAYVHRQDGFTFDAGPTIITAPFLFEELWALCGRRLRDDVELRAVDPFYRIRFDDGSHFDYSGDLEAMRAEVERFAPGDLQGFERFMAKSEAIYRIGFEKLGDKPFLSVGSMLAILPDYFKLEAYRTVYGLVCKYLNDAKLRMVFSFHPLLVGGNPFTTTSIYTLINFLERKFGVHYAMGGTGSLVKGLVTLIEGQGGRLRYKANVQSIVVEDRRAKGVMLQSGEELGADIVVSNADVATTYQSLVPSAVKRRWNERRVANARSSMSLFVWYFGTKRLYPDVLHHTILLGPRYRGLIEDIFQRKVLAEDFSLYLHRPTATDPSVAPEGCDAFYVLSPVPHLESGTDWASMGHVYRDKIAAHLEATILPELQDNIVTSRIMTPLDFRDRLQSFRGAAFSLEPIFTQSAWFRPHNRSEDIEGLFIAGAGTHPGAGLPGVLSSARVLDAIVPAASAYR